jgi:predicted phosphodiesterase
MGTLEEFAREASPKEYRKLLNESIATLEREGYLVHKPKPADTVIDFDVDRIRGDRVKLAIISDTHLGSKQQQLTYLREFAKYVKKQKVDAVLHCGDVVDGPPQMHPGHLHNIFLQTYEAQRSYAIEHLPDFGVPTYLISGNHDESWLKNNAGPIVKDICEARPGYEYVGQSAGYVRFGSVMIYMHHPHDGGAYALSYKLQKKIEALSPENRPHIFLAGNYHKTAFLPNYRNTAGFLLPSYQAQTPFMISKGLPSDIGGVILEFGTDSRGMAPSMKVEFVTERVPKENDW